MNVTLTLGNLAAVIDEIAATDSRSEKEDILRRNDSLFLRDVLSYAYDPTILFEFIPNEGDAGSGITDMDHSHFMANIDRILRAPRGSTRRFLYDQLISAARPEAGSLINRIVRKDLRCGITDKTINKVFPGLIPEFNVMLAHSFEPKRVKKWPVFAEPKLDGVRVFAVCRRGAIGFQVRFFSRRGKPMAAFEHLEQAISDAAVHAQTTAIVHSSFAWDSFVLDGEMVSGSFNETVAKARRKSEAALDAVFNVFDVFDTAVLGDASKAKFDLPYEDRRQIVKSVAAASAFLHAKAALNPLVSTTSYLVSSVDEIHTLYDNVTSRGLEGLIIKIPGHRYVGKRSHAWLKIKGEETEDLRVIGYFEGAGKYAGILGGLIVERQGIEVRIGGGFSDDQRKEIWTMIARAAVVDDDSRIIGRLIEVEYHEVTPDGSLRHPRFKRWRDDKG